VFRVFLRGAAIGTVEASLNRTDDGWLIRGTSRLGAPLDLTVRRLEVRYSDAWTPQTMSMELASREDTTVVHGGFQAGAPARIDIVRNGEATWATASVSADAIIVPNLVYSAYEALAVRLSTASPGTEFRAYIIPQGEIPIRVDSVTDETIQTAGRTIQAKRWRITFMNPTGGVPADVWVDGGRLARFDMPTQALTVARDDVAGVGARIVAAARPNDEQIFIPAAGFSLAATISKPAPAARALPVIILVGGSGPIDRDEMVAGIPVFGQLAGSLADAGYLVVRYDKRGVGQSGGRLEAATISDFAEDVRAIVQSLRKRKDADSRRIAVFGHSEGGWVALVAASREKRIAALILAGSVATKGADLILEQQRHLLAQSTMPEAERQKAIELQKKILNAVLTGRGWEEIPAAIRQQTDTPWYQSLLHFDPLPLFRRVQQPLLVVHGELDRQVPIHHADELAQLGRARPKGRGVDLVKFPVLNHLFVPASTGEISEYATLKDRTVSPQLATVVGDWLQKTLPARPSR